MSVQRTWESVSTAREHLDKITAQQDRDCICTTEGVNLEFFITLNWFSLAALRSFVLCSLNAEPYDYKPHEGRVNVLWVF